jgi:hypothetical protein
MGVNSILLIVAAVTVALGGAAVAFRFVGGNRRTEDSGEILGMSPTKLMLKLIVLGLALFVGLAMFLLYSRGGG